MLMVIMLNPYTGGEVTVSVSNAERLALAGWINEEQSAPATSVATQGQVTEAETPAAANNVEAAGSKPKGNASRAEWRDYATGLGIDVDGLNRTQIRDAVTEHEAN